MIKKKKHIGNFLCCDVQLCISNYTQNYVCTTLQIPNNHFSSTLTQYISFNISENGRHDCQRGRWAMASHPN